MLVKIRRKALVSENALFSLKEKQLKNQIKSREEELTNLAIDIDDKNSFFKNLKTHIKKIKKNTSNPLINEELQSILFNANDFIKRTQYKTQMLLEVDKTNKEFYYKLKFKHPELTEKEIKIISYLRINMSSRQIADILNITELSINNLRLRIRKKLGLKKRENLVNFVKRL